MPHQFPAINDITAVQDDNAKVLVERADAMVKAQDDGLKAMEARMSSLFGQSVTLASAAIAAMSTAFAARLGGPGAPTWALSWAAYPLIALSACWLAATALAGWSMLSQTWKTSGVEPSQLYTEQMLAAPANSLRLLIARTLQDAIDQNALRTLTYSRRLTAVIALLAAGPVIAASVAAWEIAHQVTGAAPQFDYWYS